MWAEVEEPAAPPDTSYLKLKSLSPPSIITAYVSQRRRVKYLSPRPGRALPLRSDGREYGSATARGFHPMPLIQYGPALGVGVVGE